MDTKRCAHCTKEFSKPMNVSRVTWEQRTKYCSRTCRNAAVRPARKSCVHCGALFDPTGQPRKKFCSQRCKGAHRTAAAMVERVCEVCGVSFKVRRSHQAPALFCSNACRGIGHGERIAGERHPLWKGGRTINRSGYVRVWIPDDHPFASMKPKNQSGLLEHRLVMAEHLGRVLLPTETVHHRDGNRANNDLTNLELRTGHHGQGATKHCPTCTCEG